MANEIKIAIRQTSAATSEAAIRQHKTLIDRPAAKGGDDQGPMGGELFLAAIGGCFMSNLLAAIKGREAEISDGSRAVREADRYRRPRMHYDEHAAREARYPSAYRRAGLDSGCKPGATVRVAAAIGK